MVVHVPRYKAASIPDGLEGELYDREEEAIWDGALPHSLRDLRENYFPLFITIDQVGYAPFYRHTCGVDP